MKPTVRWRKMGPVWRAEFWGSLLRARLIVNNFDYPYWSAAEREAALLDAMRYYGAL